MPPNVTLASSLLDLEIEQHQQANGHGGRMFKTGIMTLDKDLSESLWRGGDVIAIGADGAGVKQASLPLELVVSHLLALYMKPEPNPGTDSISSISTSDPTPSVYIIAPPYQATSTIQRLYTMLKTRLQQPTKPTPSTHEPTAIESTIKSHLSRISLLQYLDVSGLAESISEVLAAITDSHTQTSDHRSIVLIQGLNSMVTTTYRRTGTLQTAAVLSSIMQGLRNIARISLRGGGSCLVLVESDVVWDGGASAAGTGGDERARQQNQNQNTPPGIGGGGGGSTNTGTTTSGLKSAFSSRTGKILRVNVNGVFARIVEEGVDVFVAVHDGEGRIEKGAKERVVECVRDERGFVGLEDIIEIGVVEGEEDDNWNSRSSREVNAFGSWGVWS